MGIFKMIGMLFVVPTTVLLTASFFVIAVNSKAESKGLKLFGWLVALLLWISAFAVFSTGMWFSNNARQKVMGKGGLHIFIGRGMMKGHCPGKMTKGKPAVKQSGTSEASSGRMKRIESRSPRTR